MTGKAFIDGRLAAVLACQIVRPCATNEAGRKVLPTPNGPNQNRTCQRGAKMAVEANIVIPRARTTPHKSDATGGAA